MMKFFNGLLIFAGAFLLVTAVYILLREMGITSGKEYGIGMAVVYAVIGGALLTIGLARRKNL